MKPWVRYLIALLVAAHGLVYLNGARGVLPIFEGWKGSSWLLGSAVTGEALKRLCLVMWAVAGIGVVATSIAFAFWGQTVWRPLAIVASAVAVVSFFLFWDGQIRRAVAQGIIGAIISLLMLVAAIVFPRVLGRAGW